jgi:RNA polymerase sigma-70 factor, ECF subfamily
MTIYRDYEMMRCWVTYGDSLKSYIYNKVRDKQVTQDLTQDLYINIFQHCKRYDFSCEKAGVKNLKSWLFQSAHNLVLDHLKKSGVSIKLSQDFDEKEFENDNLAKNDMTELIAKQIDKLPEKYALPLKLSEIEGLKHKEIAIKLNLTLTATKSRIQRAKTLLKNNIIDKGFVELDKNGNLISVIEHENFACC